MVDTLSRLNVQEAAGPGAAPTQAQPLAVTPVGAAAAAALEAAEAHAWADLYAAAPRTWARAAGHGAREIGGALVLHWRATGRRYFSRAIGLGVTAPATEQALDAILARWEQLGVDAFLVQSLPHCAPAAYERWLRERGLEPFDAQDRIVRGDQPASALPAVRGGRALVVERVGPATAAEWSDFLQRVYGLDTGPWLPRLIGRPGWHQYVARERGEIVAARGMFIGPERWAWLGMDGPVPGLATQDYAPDAALCAAMVEDGLAHGARGFLADVEARSATQDTPAYGAFAALGFTLPYTRTHWTRTSDALRAQREARTPDELRAQRETRTPDEPRAPAATRA